ncbi:MAG: DUF1893 domain-containing protein [Rikenellaceae bacterium]
MLDLLDKGGYSLVCRSRGGEIRCFTSRGVDDIFHLLCSEPEFLKGATLADKIIGKGAAALMIKAGVSEVSTHVVSEGALKIFEKSEIKLNFEQTTPYVINRDKSGWCPLEARLKDENDLEKIIEIINKRFDYAN